MTKLLINSESSGKYHTENRGDRKFLVTQMLPIQADSIMNGLLYPASAVFESYNQLDKLPAPAGHPYFDGKSVSAFDPEGAAAFNVGAFVRSPKMEGANVVADLVIDIEVANRSDEGKEIISRIKNGKKMGVSTGLKAKVLETSGKQGSKEYQGVVNSIKFDHVAILLSEPPAGEITYTLNTGEFFNQKPKGNTIMREVIIATDELSLENHKLIESVASNPKAIIAALNHQVTGKEAEDIVTNSGKLVFNGTQSQLDDFFNNQDLFTEFKSKQNESRKESIEFALSNSKMKREQLESMTTETIDSIVASIVPANKHIVNGSVQAEASFSLIEGA